jgi:hypothetical protein
MMPTLILHSLGYFVAFLVLIFLVFAVDRLGLMLLDALGGMVIVSSPFHGANEGSNPSGDANQFNKICVI